MTRRSNWLAFAVAVVASVAFAWSAASAADRPPNFVIILVDDMGYGDIGCYGSTLNKTPNCDRLAAEGTRLTSFYAAPVCTPSRASLMTGCYAALASRTPTIWAATMTGRPGQRRGRQAQPAVAARPRRHGHRDA